MGFTFSFGVASFCLPLVAGPVLERIIKIMLKHDSGIYIRFSLVLGGVVYCCIIVLLNWMGDVDAFLLLLIYPLVMSK